MCDRRIREVSKRNHQEIGFRGPLLAIILFIFSCSAPMPETPPPGPSSHRFYFDLSYFIQSEVARLDSTNVEVEKQVTWEDKKETIRTRIADWNRELLPFTESDINKPALQGKYDVDTLEQNGQPAYLYTASDSSLRVKMLLVKPETREMVAQMGTHNYLYESVTELRYSALEGYTISGKQKTGHAPEKEYLITVRFLQP